MITRRPQSQSTKKRLFIQTPQEFPAFLYIIIFLCEINYVKKVLPFFFPILRCSGCLLLGIVGTKFGCWARYSKIQRNTRIRKTNFPQVFAFCWGILFKRGFKTFLCEGEIQNMVKKKLWKRIRFWVVGSGGEFILDGGFFIFMARLCVGRCHFLSGIYEN